MRTEIPRLVGLGETQQGTEPRCRIPSCRADGSPRDLSMTNKERKHEKAVKKIETAVRKAVARGVSGREIEGAVGHAIVQATEKVAAKKAAAMRTLTAPVEKVVTEKVPVEKVVAKKAPVKKAAIKKARVRKVVARNTPAEQVAPEETSLVETVAEEAPAEEEVANEVSVEEVEG